MCLTMADDRFRVTTPSGAKSLSNIKVVWADHLVVKLFELLRGVGVGIRGCVVLNSPSLLQQQSAQPAVLTCRDDHRDSQRSTERNDSYLEDKSVGIEVICHAYS